jgi:hypothetical protein
MTLLVGQSCLSPSAATFDHRCTHVLATGAIKKLELEEPSHDPMTGRSSGRHLVLVLGFPNPSLTWMSVRLPSAKCDKASKRLLNGLSFVLWAVALVLV